MRIIHHKTEHGFTLLELTLVLLILSMLSALYLAAKTQQVRQKNRTEVQRRMDSIETAFQTFRLRYNRLPCPSDGTALITTANFGAEASTPGTCTGVNANDGANTVFGVVPTKALGLADEFMFDPWGGRFSYAVDKRMTASGAFTTYTISNSTVGSITIKDVSGTYRDQHAIATLISYGPNGHGSYQLSGVRKSARSAEEDELLNCSCDQDAAATTFYPYFTQKTDEPNVSTPTKIFDDIVRYYKRTSFVSVTEAP